MLKRCSKVSDFYSRLVRSNGASVVDGKWVPLTIQVLMPSSGRQNEFLLHVVFYLGASPQIALS